jgi:hypothetical protein
LKINAFMPNEYGQVLFDSTTALDVREHSIPELVQKNGGNDLSRIIVENLSKTHDLDKFIKHEARVNPKANTTNTEGRLKSYRLEALSNIAIDRALRYVVDIGSLVLGDIAGRNSDIDFSAVGLRDELIMYRAKHSITRLIVATNHLMGPYPASECPDSIWDKVKITNLSPDAKPTAKISREESDLLHRLRYSLYSQPKEETDIDIKPRLFKAIGHSIASRLAKGRQSSSNKTSEHYYNSVLNLITVLPFIITKGEVKPFEIDRPQIQMLNATMTKVSRLARSAARVDESIANEPAAQYLAYLLEQLGGMTIYSEQTAFDKRVSRAKGLATSYNAKQ